MNESKKRREEPRDRLSELPNSILFEIFGFLPTRAFVQTTILSKRWNNLWTTTPYLDFDTYHDSDSGFHEFVNRALILWKGFRILKFKLYFGSLRNRSVFSDIDGWLLLAKENGVEKLYLRDVDRYHPSDEMYTVPHNLYSCASLKVLSLSGCKLQIHESVLWNQLKRLTISGCVLDEHYINLVVSGSPQLEDLILHFSDRNENLSIQSSSLKHLFIGRHFDEEPSIVTEMRIWSPNLETLDLRGMPYDNYSLLNVFSLTELTLDLFYEFGGYDFVGEMFWEIFTALQDVEKVTLSDWCIKGLAEMDEKYVISPLLDFRFLTINTSFVEYKEIVDLLQMFPKLETLVLVSEYYCWNPGMHGTSFLDVERNFPESFLLHLQTVEITYVDGDSLISPFIETLLKHASKLQEMVIRINGLEPHTPLMASCLALQQKVLRMPRSSPTAELIVVDY